MVTAYVRGYVTANMTTYVTAYMRAYRAPSGLGKGMEGKVRLG